MISFAFLWKTLESVFVLDALYLACPALATSSESSTCLVGVVALHTLACAAGEVGGEEEDNDCNGGAYAEVGLPDDADSVREVADMAAAGSLDLPWDKAANAEMEDRAVRLQKLGLELVADRQRPLACSHGVSYLEASVGNTNAVHPDVGTDGQAFHTEGEQNVCSWLSWMGPP